MQPHVSCGRDTPNTLRGDAPPLQRYAGLLRYHTLFFFQSSFRKLKENTVQASHILPQGGGLFISSPLFRPSLQSCGILIVEKCSLENVRGMFMASLKKKWSTGPTFTSQYGAIASLTLASLPRSPMGTFPDLSLLPGLFPLTYPPLLSLPLPKSNSSLILSGRRLK